MTISPLAGKPAPPDLLIDVDQLVAAYYANQPELSDPTQLVAFGTSGHRGTPFEGSFTEAHILAITQAICDYRRREKISGPLFMGRTRTLPPALPSALLWKCWQRTMSKPSSR